MIWTDGTESVDTEGMVELLYERGQIDDVYLAWRVNNKGGVLDFIDETAKAMESAAAARDDCREFRGWVLIPDAYALDADDMKISDMTETE